MLRSARIDRLLMCALPLLAAGCQPSGSPSERSGQAASSHRSSPLSFLKPHRVGTEAAASPTPPVVANPVDSGNPLARRPDTGNIVVVAVRFDILRLRVPKGVFSQSGKIWNHLDEQAVPAATSAGLQKNGLRVAIGRPDSWPPIRALLEPEKKIESSESKMTLVDGQPLTLDINPGLYRDQTFFLFRRDGTLGGVTCPMSRNLIRIEYAIAIENPRAVQVDVMPQLQQREVRGPLTINALGSLDQPLQEPTRVLRELAFRAVVPPEQFVVIGPSAAAWSGHLAGSLLLCEQIEGKPYESMYFITPGLQRSDDKTEGGAVR